MHRYMYIPMKKSDGNNELSPFNSIHFPSLLRLTSDIDKYDII